MTQPTRELIDRIVREVLARLEDAPVDGPVETATVSSPRRELVVHARMISLADLEGRLDGVRRLVVSPKTVVTPSVRDELHRRRVTLVCEERPDATPTSGTRLAVHVLAKHYDPAGLARDLQQEAIEVEVERFDCAKVSTERMAEQVGRIGTLGLMLTETAALAICLANRHANVRAVWGIDASRVQDDLDTVSGNVLIVDPRMMGPFPLRRIVTRFCQRGLVPLEFSL